MSEKENYVRLARPKTAGVKVLLFSRLFIMALLIVLELAVVVLPFVLLREYISHFFIAMLIFTLVMLSVAAICDLEEKYWIGPIAAIRTMNIMRLTR